MILGVVLGLWPMTLGPGGAVASAQDAEPRATWRVVRVEGELDTRRLAASIIERIDACDGDAGCPGVELVLEVGAARDDLVFEVASRIVRARAPMRVAVGPGASGVAAPGALLIGLSGDAIRVREGTRFDSGPSASLRRLAPEATPWGVVELDQRRLLGLGLESHGLAAGLAGLIAPVGPVTLTAEGALVEGVVPGEALVRQRLGEEPRAVFTIESIRPVWAVEIDRAWGRGLGRRRAGGGGGGGSGAEVLASGLGALHREAVGLLEEAEEAMVRVRSIESSRSRRGDDEATIRRLRATAATALERLGAIVERDPEVAMMPPTVADGSGGPVGSAGAVGPAGAVGLAGAGPEGVKAWSSRAAKVTRWLEGP